MEWVNAQPLPGQLRGPAPKAPKKALEGPPFKVAYEMFAFRRDAELKKLAVDETGKLLAASYQKGQLAIWKLETDKAPKLRARDHKELVTALVFHGTTLLSADAKGRVRAFDVKKGKALWHLSATDELDLGYVRVLFPEPEGTLWVSGSGGSARLDLLTGEVKHAWPHLNRVLCASRDVETQNMVLGCVGETVVSSLSGEELARYTLGEGDKGVVWVGKEQGMLLSLTQDGAIYDREEFKWGLGLGIPWEHMPVVVYQDWLVAGRQDGSIACLRLDGSEAHEAQMHAGPVHHLLGSGDGRIYSAGQDGFVALLELESGTQSRTRASRFALYALAIGQGEILAAGEEGIVRGVGPELFAPFGPLERNAPELAFDFPKEAGVVRGVVIEGDFFAAVAEERVAWRLSAEADLVSFGLPPGPEGYRPGHNTVAYNSQSKLLMVRHHGGVWLVNPESGESLFESEANADIHCFGSGFLLAGKGQERGVVYVRPDGKVEAVDQGFCTRAALSPEKRKVALYGDGKDQRIIVFDDAWNPLCEIAPELKPSWVLWSDSGEEILVRSGGGSEQYIAVYKQGGPQVSATATSGMFAWSFSSKKKLLLSLDAQGVLSAHQEGERLWERQFAPEELTRGEKNDVVLNVSPDGERLVISGRAPAPLLVDTADGRIIRRLDEVPHPLLHDIFLKAAWLGPACFVICTAQMPSNRHQPVLYQRDGEYTADLSGHVAGRHSKMCLISQTPSGRIMTLDDPEAVPMIWNPSTGALEAIGRATESSAEAILFANQQEDRLALASGKRVTVHRFK